MNVPGVTELYAVYGNSFFYLISVSNEKILLHTCYSVFIIYTTQTSLLIDEFLSKENIPVLLKFFLLKK